MGAYLSQPNTMKSSADGGNEHLSFGYSAMQGWRVSMEDAHNCIPKLDEDTALFAVYDGHGGEEVALYCSKYFPEVLKEQKSYKEGKLQKGLEEAFLAIDARMTQEDVIKELSEIAGRPRNDEEEKGKVAEEDDVDNEETALLHEEATMTIEELLVRYGQNLNTVNTVSKASSVNKCVDKEDMENRELQKNANGQNSSEELLNDQSASHDSSKDDVEQISSSSTSLESEGAKRGTSLSSEKHEKSEEEVSSSTGDSRPSCSSNTGRLQWGTKSKFFEDSEDESEGAEDQEEECSEEEEEEEDDDDDDEEEECSADEDDDQYSSADEGDDSDDAEEEVLLPGMDGKEEPGSDSGTTAVVALIRGNQLIVANAGDSRCVVSENGKAVDMSYDHKPEDEVELARIKNAGGKVTLDGRVNGGLNLSRAIGDHFYKRNKNLPPDEQMISALPDLKVLTLTDTHDFMVIACDGIWNVMSSQEVVDFISERLLKEKKKETSLSSIVEELLDQCLAPDTSGDGTGCDNMTCIIVRFLKKSNCSQIDSKRKWTVEEENGNVDSKKLKTE
ncbi:protein phosphatase 1G [Erpetoichthys calabaricus]|uniref:Protein phosphatase 1G n=1 Tax=Erpetoichthys calabaricus TaxID=27687 RepID=A0A8C4SQG0_ERPCA|nr:protein phosphatase 1G [Erpetoichthys calabaricus]